MQKRECDINKLHRITQAVLRCAEQRGATAAEADAALAEGYTVYVRMGELETVEHHQDRGIGITVYFGHQKGSVSTADFTEEGCAKAVETACNIARFTEPDPYSGLADKDRMAVQQHDLDVYHPWDIPIEEAIAMAMECDRYGRGLDARVTQSENVSVSTHTTVHVYANTHGFSGSTSNTSHSIGCGLIAKDKDSMETDGSYTVHCDAQQLKSLEYIAQEACQRSLDRLHARTIPTGKYPVIFSSRVSKQLIGVFLRAISGSALYRRSSFLMDALGRPVFPEYINVYECPQMLGKLYSTCFDSEGVATYDKHFVQDGILQHYVLGSYAARKLQMHSTGNAGGVSNLFVSHSDVGLSDLLEQMGTGLLVHQSIGQGINLVTGHYSKGISGFWVEHGKIKHPVAGVTIAGNLKDMFQGIVAVGNDPDPNSNIQVGSILVSEMMAAGGPA